MGRKNPPAYQLHKGTGQACCKVNGKFHYLGKHGTPESKKRYAELLGGKEPGKAAPIRSITVSDMIVLFLERNPAEYPANSPEPRQFAFALTPLARLCGHLAVNDVQPHHIEEVRRAMVSGSWLTAKEKESYTKRGHRIGACRGVVNRRLARVKLAFRRAELWGLIPSGIYARLMVIRGSDTKAVPSPDIEPARFEDVLAVVRVLAKPGKGFHKARGKELAAMLLLQWWTGARPGEIRIMRPMDIDQTGDVWTYKPGSDEPHGRHKNAWRGQDRSIPLGPKCQAVLKPILAGLKPDAWAFPSRRGPGPYKDTSYTNAIRRAARKAGVSLFAYQCRHATKRRIELSHGEAAAKAILGQESLDSTRKYAKRQDVELAKKIAGKAG